MSQDKDDSQNFTDSSEDEKFDISTASSETSEKITDDDSSKSNSEVDDNQVDDKGQCAAESSRPISLSIDLQEPCLSIKAVKQADVHQQLKIPGTPTKRRFPFSNEDSTSNADFKRSTISSSSQQKAEESKSNNAIESNLPLTPAVITREKFENEFTKVADEENKNNQHSSQRTEFDSQSPTAQSIQRQSDAYSSVSDADKQVNIHKETRTSETATKLGLLPSNDNSESRSDPEKQVSSIKPYEEVETDATIAATTELNLPPPRIFISLEYFKTEFTKVFEEYNKRNSQLSSQHLKFFPQNPQKQTDCPSSSSDVPKQVNIQQQTKVPGNSTNLGYRSLEELLDCPTNRRDPLFDEDLDSQPSSEILSNSDENEEVSSTATIDLNLPPSKFIFSPARFAREFTRISHDLNKENSKLSSQKAISRSPQTWPGDPCSSKQSDTQHGKKRPKTPQKRRLSSEENSGLQPDSKKYIASTRPLAKVKGHARTPSSSELQLPSSRDVFAPERFEQEFAKYTGAINKQNTQHSSQGSSLQNPDPRLRNVIWNPFLTIKLKNPPINRSSDSQIDHGEGPSHTRSDSEPFESPISHISSESQSQTGGINFSEIACLMNRLHSENLKNRRLEIAARLGILADHIKEFRNLLNAMSVPPIIPPSHLTRSHSLQERRDLARSYHRETIAERQLFLSQQPSIEILSTFATGMTDILNDIRYELSIATYNAWMFKDRVEYLIAQFRQNFCEENVGKKNKCNGESEKVVNGETDQKEMDKHDDEDCKDDQKIVNGETDKKKEDKHNDEEDEDSEDDQKIEIKLYKDFYNIFLKFSRDVEELFKGLEP
nr:serine-rich adhesin for platelets-like [Parasteatoda tepidariorum]